MTRESASARHSRATRSASAEATGATMLAEVPDEAASVYAAAAEDGVAATNADIAAGCARGAGGVVVCTTGLVTAEEEATVASGARTGSGGGGATDDALDAVLLAPPRFGCVVAMSAASGCATDRGFRGRGTPLTLLLFAGAFSMPVLVCFSLLSLPART